ncbi:hypothetical protein D6833_11265 [Candidatus Parcubacteria bacterium]|nr:MAG: hypothetical protein D6833_11265 [Candidatus Parcubacteria bacterium]
MKFPIVTILSMLLISCASTNPATDKKSHIKVTPFTQEVATWCKTEAQKVYDSCHRYTKNVYSNPQIEYSLFQNLWINNYAKKKRLEDKLLNNSDLVKAYEVADFAWSDYIRRNGKGPTTSVNTRTNQAKYVSKYICMVAASHARYNIYQPKIAKQECIKSYK